jgi:hypothetical protein
MIILKLGSPKPMFSWLFSGWRGVVWKRLGASALCETLALMSVYIQSNMLFLSVVNTRGYSFVFC